MSIRKSNILHMMVLYEGTTIMNMVVECKKEYQERYFSMKTNDWRHLLRDYVRKVTERPTLQDAEVFRKGLYDMNTPCSKVSVFSSFLDAFVSNQLSAWRMLDLFCYLVVVYIPYTQVCQHHHPRPSLVVPMA